MPDLKKLIKKGDIKFDQPNFVDRILNKLFLWVFPESITPNDLTKFRYLTIPFVFYFILHGRYEIGLVLFMISSFTDALDGAMARTRERITNWGKLHDPLADKMLIGVTGAVLITRYIGLEIILIILILELLTVFSAIHLHDDDEKEIGARLPGKIKMIFQSFGLVLLLFFSIYEINLLLLIATIFFFLAIIFSTANILLYKAL
ncbi:MAG: CDP-alcohol phosphatidyltransferase family protein [Patescibacteria group bacterium]